MASHPIPAHTIKKMELPQKTMAKLSTREKSHSAMINSKPTPATSMILLEGENLNEPKEFHSPKIKSYPKDDSKVIAATQPTIFSQDQKESKSLSQKANSK